MKMNNYTITVVGLGLIGGSILRALKVNAPGVRLQAVSRDKQALQQAFNDNLVKLATSSLEEAIPSTDVLILCVPVLTVEEILRLSKPWLRSTTLVTDVCSVKGEVIKAAKRVFGTLPSGFIPGHPIAGSEKSGYAASIPELFSQRRVILTPTDTTSEEAISAVSAMWELTGAQVALMSADQHDQILGATSHLPHLLSYAMVDLFAKQAHHEEIFLYAAGGFRDFTRIAGSDPVMWRDIFLTNGEATIRLLDNYVEELHELKAAIQRADGDHLEATFRRAKAARDMFTEIFSRKSSDQ
jgi:prephenate dehydrogenase